MVAIPVTQDQPTIAQRIVWTRTGEMVALGDLNLENLHSAIRNDLRDRVYRDSALRFREGVRSVDGLTRAVKIVEAVIENGDTVLRDAPSAQITL